MSPLRKLAGVVTGAEPPAVRRTTFEEFAQGSGAASAVSFNSQEILEDTLDDNAGWLPAYTALAGLAGALIGAIQSALSVSISSAAPALPFSIAS